MYIDHSPYLEILIGTRQTLEQKIITKPLIYQKYILDKYDRIMQIKDNKCAVKFKSYVNTIFNTDLPNYTHLLMYNNTNIKKDFIKTIKIDTHTYNIYKPTNTTDIFKNAIEIYIK